MVALRETAGASAVTLYGLALGFFFLGVTHSGQQDLAALMRATEAAETQPPVASRFGIHLATFSLPRPIGTLTPEPEPGRLARFVPSLAGARVNRAAKGDLAVPRVQVMITAELLREDQKAAGLVPEDPEDLDFALRYEPFPEYDIALSFELHPQVPAAPALASVASGTNAEPGADAQEAEGPGGDTRVYFEPAPMGAVLASVEPWAPGEAPIVMVPAVVESATAALEPARPTDETAAGEPAHKAARAATASISPAQLLGLNGRARAKAEKCLANAVYFEARSEPVRGQIAVAQVVLNRAFSGYYPEDVCGVVYQGANRHLSCQFTFACDGIPDVVTEPEHYRRAMRIAAATLDGKVWLPDVGRATHYHASYVYPYWVRSMRRLKKIGLHSFYRPRKWGDGSDAPSWGARANAELVAQF
jgi:spore germination cell wall hydrolase CwlJ-like protein